MTTTRRDAHSGSIYQRKSDGMWVVAVELPERDGKRRRKVIVRAKKADAVTALRAARKDLLELTVAGALEFVRRETGATTVTLGFGDALPADSTGPGIGSHGRDIGSC